MSQEQKAFQKALKESGYVEEGEIITSWVVVAEIAGQDHGVRLMHRAGGGVDGEEAPALWEALGMMRATVLLLERDLTNSSGEPEP